MITGGRTPEDLETLMEDACVLRDAEALARLFEDDGVLLVGDESDARGGEEIARAALLVWDRPGGYLAQPRQVLACGDTALLMGDGVINVARRGHDRSWRFAIAWLQAAASGAELDQDGRTT